MSDMDAKVIPDCCEQLKQARITQKLSVKSVADQLKLPSARIDEIEEGRFIDSVSPAFYRGYIRSYANLLKIDNKELLSQFNELFEETTEIKSTSRMGAFGERKSEVSSGEGVFKWISRAIIFVILAAVAWGIKERFLKNDVSGDSSELTLGLLEGESAEYSSNETNEDTTEQPQQNDRIANLQDRLNESSNSSDDAKIQTDTTAVLESEVADNTSSKDNSTLDKTINQDPQEKNPIQLDNNSSELAQDSLTLVFVGDCWVDIRDSNGKRLAYGVKQNGVVLTLDGVAPFAVTLGDPSVVNMQFNNESVDLSGYRAGRPAKLNLKK
ncbi:MAG: DUF4115 domain-containing protein [Gammaproteobacteria bacterium]|nr:DUF4115 domain-containing protein [Gammaproteobacteria bacterium]